MIGALIEGGLFVIGAWTKAYSWANGNLVDIDPGTPEGWESVPKSEMGTPIPLIYGTTKMSPLLAWMGNRAFYPDVTFGGFTYGCDLLYVLGTPAYDSADAPWSNWRSTYPPRLQKMYVGNAPVDVGTGGPTTSDGLLHGQSCVRNVNLGGRGSGGELSVAIEFFDGRSNQLIKGRTPLPYTIEAALIKAGVNMDLVPGYRHQMLVAVTMSEECFTAAGTTGSGNFGERPVIPSFSFEVCAAGPDSIGAGDFPREANPAWVYFDMCRSPIWKMGLAADEVDETTFGDAADTLVDEEHGMSMAITEERSVSDIAKTVLAQIEGVSYASPES